MLSPFLGEKIGEQWTLVFDKAKNEIVRLQCVIARGSYLLYFARKYPS